MGGFFVYNVKQKVPRERQMKPDSWCHLDNAGKCWSLQWLCGKIFMCDPHLHKIFCFLLKTKGKACLAGSVPVTLVKLRAGSGLGVIQGRVPSPWGEGAEPGASPAQQGQAAGQGLGKMTENTISLFCCAMTSFPCIPHYPERAECSKCWFFWAVPGFDPRPGALTHPELSWSTNPNSLSMAPSVGQPWARPAEVMKISFVPLCSPVLPTKGWGGISKEGLYYLGWNHCFLRALLEAAGLWISEITAHFRSWNVKMLLRFRSVRVGIWWKCWGEQDVPSTHPANDQGNSAASSKIFPRSLKGLLTDWFFLINLSLWVNWNKIILRFPSWQQHSIG